MLTKLEPVEAFTIIVLSGALSDGSIDEEERDIIVNVIGRMNAFRQYKGDLRQLFERSMKLIKQNPGSALQLAILSLPKNLHDTAFAVTADVVMSDGTLSPSEEQALSVLYEALSVSKSKATKIIEVMQIKNKG